MATGLSSSIFTPKALKSKARPRHVAKVVVATVAVNRSYWDSIQSEIDAYLKKSIPIRSPESVFEPMHHLTFAAPQTTASALCLAACELVGGEKAQAMAAAAAIHLMHAAIYTHQHLPVTDRPPTSSSVQVQHKYNPNIELLTGDGIMPFGMELLARSVNEPDKILRVMIEISRTCGAQGLVDGQYRELELPAASELLEYVCRKKEGELHACGAACGAILGGGADGVVDKLRNFGFYIGTAQGMAKRGSDDVDKWIEMALKELESFQVGNTAELISGLVEQSRAPVYI